MKDIAIYGAGGFGREIATAIKRMNQKRLEWNLLGFFDDGIEKGTNISHYGKVIGGIGELNTFHSPLCIAIAIGNPSTLKSVREQINNPMISFPNIIIEPFEITDSETFKMGEGNIIQGGCWISCDVSIGNFNILNGNVVMGHDVTIGNYNTIMPNVRISGEVSIGNGNLIGVGSIILQQLKIGDSVHLGAGAVLFTKPKDGNTYIGNPAKIFRY